MSRFRIEEKLCLELVPPLQQYWNSELGNSVLWRAVLNILACLAAPRPYLVDASNIPTLELWWLKIPPDTAKCHKWQSCSLLTTPGLEKILLNCSLLRPGYWTFSAATKSFSQFNIQEMFSVWMMAEVKTNYEKSHLALPNPNIVLKTCITLF